MRIFDLAFKDLLQILRDWKSFLFLLFMPVLFTLVFGFAFGGIGSSSEKADARLPVGLLDQDAGQLSPVLFDLMEKSDAIRPETFEKDTSLEKAEKKVADDELAGLVIIPKGYSASFLDDQTLKLTTILKGDSSAGAAAQSGIQAVVSRLTHAVETARFSTQIRDQQLPFGSEVERQAFFAESLEKAVAAWDRPPFRLVTSQTGSSEKEPAFAANAFAHSSPGMMVQFAIAGLIGAAEVLVIERKSGSLRRLLTTALSRSGILAGHFLAMFLMIFMQLAILIGFAAIFLDVAYFSAPLATLVVALATAIFTASMGMLIGTLAKNEEQAVMFALFPMFILSGLGGAWVPLELTNPTFQAIGHFTPVAWAMDGFQNIILRGLGLESVLLPAAVLLGFALLCLSLAVWRFRFE